MKDKVYLDSTIPSFYYDEREDVKAWCEVTKKWWETQLDNYEIFISDEVLVEIGDGEYPNKNKIVNLIKNIPILEEVPEIKEIAEYYINNYLMPQTISGDASHLAYASF